MVEAVREVSWCDVLWGMAPDGAEMVYSAAGFGNYGAGRAVKSLWAWGGAIRGRVPVLVAIDARGA